ncbi:MAG: recombinase family protein [Lachnospiraceae bacterium]|nr:recombinase family protein [Lachnospiraceae bacterium]
MNDLVLAFYLRLSMADGDLGSDNKDESNSIENQRLLLQSYIERHDDLMGEVKEYVDDGYTGTNFERPGFQKLLEDAKAGVIQCILVKDLSRLGRDYIGVGDYIEQIFPVLGVRFIAVNNNFDSAAHGGMGMGLDLAVTNLINNLYSRDISKKVRSAFEVKWKQGHATAADVPFGYLKKVGSNGKWEIDPVASKYVRRIFDLALEGFNTSQIAYQLNRENIPTPGLYLKGKKKNGTQGIISPDSELLWTCNKVWITLNKYEYTGALVMGKKKKLVLGGKTRVQVPEEDRIIYEGAHEAIVTHEEFEAARAVIRSIRKGCLINKSEFPLKKFVRCGTCRHLMEYRIVEGEGMFRCAHKRSAGVYSSCYGGRFREPIVNANVFYAIKNMLCTAKFLQGKLQEDSVARSVNLELPDTDKLQKELEILREERVRQYEAYADGVIGRDTYLNKKRKISEQIEEIQAKIKHCEEILQEEDAEVSSIRQITDQADSIPLSGRLTAEIVQAFVETVYLYEDNRMEVVFKCGDVLDEAVDNYMIGLGLHQEDDGTWVYPEEDGGNNCETA